jgi:hypothetical protein
MAGCLRADAARAGVQSARDLTKPIVIFSATTGAGVTIAAEGAAQTFAPNTEGKTTSPTWTRTRHSIFTKAPLHFAKRHLWAVPSTTARRAKARARVLATIDDAFHFTSSWIGFKFVRKNELHSRFMDETFLHQLRDHRALR